MSQAVPGDGPGIDVPVAPNRGVRPHSQVWAIVLVAGLASGFVSWCVGELVHEVFKPQLFSIKVALTTFIQPTAASLNAADLKNAALVFTILGGFTTGMLGFAGGFAARSLARGLVVGLGGLVMGAIVGGLASLGLLPYFFQGLVPDPNDLMAPILVHGGIWMAIGAAAGLAFAVGIGYGRSAFNAIGGACFGALFATLLFHGLGEVLFPDSGSTSPLATTMLVRLMEVFLVTVLIALGAAKGALGRVSRPRGPAPALS